MSESKDEAFDGIPESVSPSDEASAAIARDDNGNGGGGDGGGDGSGGGGPGGGGSTATMLPDRSVREAIRALEEDSGCTVTCTFDERTNEYLCEISDCPPRAEDDPGVQLEILVEAARSSSRALSIRRDDSRPNIPAERIDNRLARQETAAQRLAEVLREAEPADLSDLSQTTCTEIGQRLRSVPNKTRLSNVFQYLGNSLSSVQVPPAEQLASEIFLLGPFTRAWMGRLVETALGQGNEVDEQFWRTVRDALRSNRDR